MRVVFLGTPDFAVPALDALAPAHEVVAVFTQPDRPKGRGRRLAASPVKLAANALDIPVYQPERIRRPDAVEQLRQLAPEIMVVVGYGQIIPQTIIDLPRHGILNVHASLLPKYRGAAPIQWAIANGEAETGVTIMQIDAGLDTGDMLLKRSLSIGPDAAKSKTTPRQASLPSSKKRTGRSTGRAQRSKSITESVVSLPGPAPIRVSAASSFPSSAPSRRRAPRCRRPRSMSTTAGCLSDAASTPL
jgi:methionyl-tRNA formyltransferase